MIKLLKKKKTILFICSLFIYFPIIAQTPISINHTADFIDADDFNNIYLVKNTEVLKYNQNGKLSCRYSNALNGQINAIDVTNPLRIMLFYRESNALIFLNQQLAIINDVIFLSNFSNAEASLACSSSEGGFWIFDELTLSLIYFDKNRTAIKQSVNLAGYLHQEEALQLSEQNQRLYLQTNTKVYIFDVYGNFLKSYHLGSTFKIKTIDNNLCYYNNGEMKCFNALNFADTVINANCKEPIKQLILNKKQLIILTEKGVKVQSEAYPIE